MPVVTFKRKFSFFVWGFLKLHSTTYPELEHQQTRKLSQLWTNVHLSLSVCLLKTDTFTVMHFTQCLYFDTLKSSWSPMVSLFC